MTLTRTGQIADLENLAIEYETFSMHIFALIIYATGPAIINHVSTNYTKLYFH